MRVGRARRLYFRWERYRRRQLLLDCSPMARWGFDLHITMGYAKAIERYERAGRWHASRPRGIREVRTFLYLAPRKYRPKD